MFSEKEPLSSCPNCTTKQYWIKDKCLRCGYVYKLSMKNDQISFFIQKLFKPILYDPQDIFIGVKSVPLMPGLYAWYFDKSLLEIFIDKKSKHYFIIPSNNLTHSVREWYLLYIGIAGKKNGRTLQDRIYTEHLNQNSKGSTLRQTLCAILWNKINLDPAQQLNTVDEKLKLTRWMFKNARVAWIEIEKPEKLENIMLDTFGECLPFNLKGNKANPYLKEIKRLRRVWRKGGK